MGARESDAQTQPMPVGELVVRGGASAARRRGAKSRRRESLEELGDRLAARLLARRAEIEEELLSVVRAVSSAAGRIDREGALGRQEAVAAALEFALAGVERSPEEPAGPTPSAVVELARRAAASGVPAEVLLRCFMAADRRLGEFVLEEGEALPTQAVRQVMRTVGERVERLASSATCEYWDEVERLQRSPGQRLAAWVQELLDGADPPVVGEQDYRFSDWHLGMIAAGPQAEHEARALAARLEAKALVVPRGNVTWVWLGRVRPVAFAELERQMEGEVGSRLRLAVGESRQGLAGWRATHAEAKAAQRVMRQRPRALVRCGYVALLSALMADDVLAAALQEAFVAPLRERGNGSSPLPETLRVYFSTGSNAAATAAALGVDRHTVHRRLRKAEQRLGLRLESCRCEVEIALQLEDLLAGEPVVGPT